MHSLSHVHWTRSQSIVRFNLFVDSRSHTSAGTGPLIWLPCSAGSCSSVSHPRSDGIDPVSELSNRLRDVRLGMPYSSLGRHPARLFRSSSSETRLLRDDHISVGIVPSKRFWPIHPGFTQLPQVCHRRRDCPSQAVAAQGQHFEPGQVPNTGRDRTRKGVLFEMKELDLRRLEQRQLFGQRPHKSVVGKIDPLNARHPHVRVGHVAKHDEFFVAGRAAGKSRAGNTVPETLVQAPFQTIRNGSPTCYRRLSNSTAWQDRNDEPFFLRTPASTRSFRRPLTATSVPPLAASLRVRSPPSLSPATSSEFAPKHQRER